MVLHSPEKANNANGYFLPNAPVIHKFAHEKRVQGIHIDNASQLAKYASQFEPKLSEMTCARLWNGKKAVQKKSLQQLAKILLGDPGRWAELCVGGPAAPSIRCPTNAFGAHIAYFEGFYAREAAAIESQTRLTGLEIAAAKKGVEDMLSENDPAAALEGCRHWLIVDALYTARLTRAEAATAIEVFTQIEKRLRELLRDASVRRELIPYIHALLERSLHGRGGIDLTSLSEGGTAKLDRAIDAAHDAKDFAIRCGNLFREANNRVWIPALHCERGRCDEAEKELDSFERELQGERFSTLSLIERRLLSTQITAQKASHLWRSDARSVLRKTKDDLGRDLQQAYRELTTFPFSYPKSHHLVFENRVLWHLLKRPGEALDSDLTNLIVIAPIKSAGHCDMPFLQAIGVFSSDTEISYPGLVN